MSRYFATFSLSVLGACVVPTTPENEYPVLVTIAALDLRGSTLEVHFQIRNESDRSIWLPRCGDWVTIFVERHESGTWQQYSSSVCPAIFLTIPLKLEPGGSVGSAVSISVPGRYRLRPHFHLDSDNRPIRGYPSAPFGL